jgi:putative hydrolase of the HAD superfamily
VDEDDRNGPLTTSETDERLRWRRIVTTVLDDVSEPDACFEALFAHFAQPQSWACYPDTAEALACLELAGYPLAIASNFDARLHGICAGLEPLRRLQPVVVSSEVGHRKPHARFYAELARQLGQPPERILHVGDDEANDHQGALRAGLQSVWLCRGGRSDSENSTTDLRDVAGRLVSARRRARLC